MRSIAVILSLAGSALLAGCSGSDPQPRYQPVGDVKHFMNYLLDPATDTIWGAAGTIVTFEGEQDLTPQTDEEWLAVLHSANVVAEAGNLLKMPGYSREGADWAEISTGLTTVGLRVIAAAEAKDGDALFETGGQLYNVCVACHQLYITEEDENVEAPTGE